MVKITEVRYEESEENIYVSTDFDAKNGFVFPIGDIKDKEDLKKQVEGGVKCQKEVRESMMQQPAKVTELKKLEGEELNA